MTLLRPARAAFVALSLAAVCATAFAADKSVVGTWKLLSWTSKDAETGATIDVFGARPTGYLTYTQGGHVSVNLSAEGRKPLSGDRFNSPVQERAQAFSTNIAFSGTYELTPEGITHRVEVATFQNWVDTDQFRFISISGNRLTMKTPAIKGPPDGRVKVLTLEFERVE